jgi:phage terminase large subunit
MDATCKYVVNQGGTSSGKTYAIVQLLFILAMQQPDMVITVAGQDIPNLKKGAYRDAIHIYNTTAMLKQQFGKPNQTDRIFTCNNGSIIEFSSFTDGQDAKSGKRDYLFVNEANGIPYEVFWQLAIRTRNRVFIDYNPTARFWVHDKLLGKPDVQLIISDHRHNPFLSEELHQEIESIADVELFNVYARGKTGKLEGLVYSSWQLCDVMPAEYKKRWIGIDFGFTNDPTAIIDVRLSEGELWVDQLRYQTKMLNSDIADVLHSYEAEQIEIVADSAEPKSIAELRNRGFKIEGAEKGADSINAGIGVVKSYRLNITRRSLDIIQELQSYCWKKDKYTGRVLNEPVDGFNHALDAIRYVALNKLGVKRKPLKIYDVS